MKKKIFGFFGLLLGFLVLLWGVHALQNVMKDASPYTFGLVILGGMAISVYAFENRQRH